MTTRRACRCCGSRRLRRQVFGLLPPEECERVEADPSLVIGGCAFTDDSWVTECVKCGYRTLIDDGEGVMPMRVAVDDTFMSRGRNLRVSRLEEEVLPRIRVFLIGVACRREQVTFGELKEGASLPQAVNGRRRLLDALAEDCERRGEPSLAALVVSAATGRGAATSKPDVRRALANLHSQWPRSTPTIQPGQIGSTRHARRDTELTTLVEVDTTPAVPNDDRARGRRGPCQ